MRLYWELTRLAVHRQFTYRAAALAGLLTNFFFGLLRAAVMAALFGARPVVEGISLQGVITYTGIAQAAIGFLSLFHWYDIIYSVYNGQIGSDLLKPMNYFGFWMAQDLGRALVNFLLRGVSLMIFYAIAFQISTPQDGGQWLALGLSIILAWAVSFAWRFLVNLSSFWIPNAVGFGRLFFLFSWFFSGFYMPLRFFPEWFQRICYLTPFPHTINTIVEIYLGLRKGQEAVAALSSQVLWFIGLWAAGQVALKLGVRRLVIQGG